MNRSTLWKSVAALALGASLMAAQTAGAQSTPGEERPGAGDTRASPGPDPKQAPTSHPSEKRPLIRQPTDRSMQPGGDIRPLPGETTRQDRLGAYAGPRTGAAPDGAAEPGGVKP
jgi:hypothetical protein